MFPRLLLDLFEVGKLENELLFLSALDLRQGGVVFDIALSVPLIATPRLDPTAEACRLLFLNLLPASSKHYRLPLLVSGLPTFFPGVRVDRTFLLLPFFRCRIMSPSLSCGWEAMPRRVRSPPKDCGWRHSLVSGATLYGRSRTG